MAREQFTLTTRKDWKGGVWAWRALQGLSVDVGIFDDAVYEDGTPVALIGFYHEYGYVGGHERSFMRSTYDQERGNLVRNAVDFLKANGPDGRGALNFIGQNLSASVVLKIESNIPPPLAPETIAAKSREGNTSSPEIALIDSGKLQSSITWRVIENGIRD